MSNFLSDLSESKSFPSKNVLQNSDETKIALQLFLNLCAVRILFEEKPKWTKDYVYRTNHWGNFDKWRSDENDLYCLLYGIKNLDREDSKKTIYGLNHKNIREWFHRIVANENTDTVARNLLMRLDNDLKINQSSLRSMKRTVMNWPDSDEEQRNQALHRLVERLHEVMPRSELLEKLRKVDTTIRENASAGASAASNVATAVGGLGCGFSDEYWRSPYPPPKKKKKTTPPLIRR